MAPRKSTGITVFIINPHLHPQFLSLFYSIIKEMVPIFRDIFCDQTGSWMNKNATQASFLEFLHLKIYPLFGDLVVPVPKWRTAVFGRWILKFGLQGSKVVDFANLLFLLFFASGKKEKCQSKDQPKSVLRIVVFSHHGRLKLFFLRRE